MAIVEGAQFDSLTIAMLKAVVEDVSWEFLIP
jgi:hypothetical protein